MFAGFFCFIFIINTVVSYSTLSTMLQYSAVFPRHKKQYTKSNLISTPHNTSLRPYIKVQLYSFCLPFGINLDGSVFVQYLIVFGHTTYITVPHEFSITLSHKKTHPLSQTTPLPKAQFAGNVYIFD